jgi:hypothetical protein
LTPRRTGHRQATHDGCNRGGSSRTGDDVCRGLEQMRPPEEMDRLCPEGGVMERQRPLHLGMWVRALVRSAGTPGGAYQADVWRSSLACEGPPVTRAAY